MTTKELDVFFRSILDIEGFESIDPSLNGLQVDNDGGDIRKAAFGVDANLETFKRAAEAGAGILFVHHGLFWGRVLPVEGTYRGRLKFLLDHNLALYAAHLPLDQHPRLGNNASLARLLGIDEPEPFGVYHGRKLGYKGKLREPLDVEEAARRIAFLGGPPLGLYPFGKPRSETCGVISGCAPQEALQAIEEGLDLYVTGEPSHQIYHDCLEGHLNLVAGGHYNTEVWGPRGMMEETAKQLGLPVEFIHVPTGL